MLVLHPAFRTHLLPLPSVDAVTGVVEVGVEVCHVCVGGGGWMRMRQCGRESPGLLGAECETKAESKTATETDR